MLKIIYLTQKAYFSPQMQYLKFLFIINRVSHENIPGLLQESQITCASEEFWENSAEKVYFLSCNKRNKALFPAFFIYFYNCNTLKEVSLVVNVYKTGMYVIISIGICQDNSVEEVCDIWNRSS